MNAGERDELLLKLYLVKLRDLGCSIYKERITSVGFDNVEYGSIPQNLVDTFQNLSECDLRTLVNNLSISKAPAGAKSDVYINGFGFSVKSSSAAPSALVNHTSRPGFENVCSRVGVSIEKLDECIDEYWSLRFSGKITEDTKITDDLCPFKNSKQILTPILEYFLFTGTGSKNSDYPAQYVLEFSNPCNPSTWRVLTPSTVVDEIWDSLIFSVRSKKGMPKDYNMNTYSKPNADSIARWTKFHSGDYRGALHIRLK